VMDAGSFTGRRQINISDSIVLKKNCCIVY